MQQPKRYMTLVRALRAPAISMLNQNNEKNVRTKLSFYQNVLLCTSLCHNKWSSLFFFSQRFCGDFLPLPLFLFSRWDKISKFCPIFVLYFTKKVVSQVMKNFVYFIYNALFLWDIQIFVITTSTLFLLSPLLEKMIIDVLQVYDAIMCV